MSWLLWPLWTVAVHVAFEVADPHRTGWVACLALGFSIPFFCELSAHFLAWVANRLAKYSYDIYLFHLPVMWLSFFVLDEPVWLQASASVGLKLAALVAVFHWVKSPMIRRGRWLAQSKSAVKVSLPLCQREAIGGLSPGIAQRV